MSKAGIMGAGGSGMRYNVNTHGNQGGGNKKQGLVPTATNYYMMPGVGHNSINRAYGKNRNVVFCMNQLGGVGRGRSQFGHGSRDGVNPVAGGCNHGFCGATPDNLYCNGGGGNYAFCAYVNIAGELKPSSGFKCPYHCPKRSYATEPISINNTTISFPNLSAPTVDTITIPVRPYTNIVSLINCGQSNAHNVIKNILTDGRNNACQDYGICTPCAQCFHLPGATSVDWMHLHTLNAAVPEELFPCVPGIDPGCPLNTNDYVCISSNQGIIWNDTDIGAKTIIQAAMNSVISI
jgi:hypothetical protein